MRTVAGGSGLLRRLLVPGLSTLISLLVLMSLGTWQLERKAWKEALIVALTQRLAAEPAALPPPEAWPRLEASEFEYRRVKFPADFSAGSPALVYTSGSSWRSDTSGPGYWVLAPARLPDGSVVVVNRGYVPEGMQADISHMGSAGKLEIVGVIRWPERPGLFTPNDEPLRNLWFVRDQRAIAAAKGWGAVAPFYVEQEAPSPPGGLPRAGKLRVSLPNDHLQYAVTWYGLALVLAVVFATYAAGQAREARGASRPVPPV